MTRTVFLALITIVCFLLVVVIMVENPKGGGLSSSFGSAGSQIADGLKTTPASLYKRTGNKGIIHIVLIFLCSLAFTGSTSGSFKTYDESSAPASVETLPSVSPAVEAESTPADEASE